MVLIRLLSFALVFCCFGSWCVEYSGGQSVIESALLQEPEPGDSDEQGANDETSPPEPGAEQELKDEPTPDRDKDEAADSDADSNDEADSEKDGDGKESSGGRTRRDRRSFSKRSEQFISVFGPVVASTSSSVVKITNGGKQIALGTIVDADGLVLTKASELKGDLKCQLADGSSLKPVIVGIDPDTDLVLLKVPAEGLNFARIDETVLPNVGAWLASVGQKPLPLTVGIVSHEPRKISNTERNSAVIGIYPEDRDEGDGVRINGVLNDTPAEEAGLLVNDIIVSIDDKTIHNRAELMETLSRLNPGDEIVLGIQRGEERMDVPVTLGKPNVNPMMDRGNRQNKMGSTLSKRRSNFPLALQHDSTLNANEIGGPVVDLDGHVIGINIARDGRVSSLALPNGIVAPIIAKLKSGKFKPAVVNKAEIKIIEKKLAKLADKLGDLPQQKMAREIEFSAGAAVEQELVLQIKLAEERLQSLRDRLDGKKKANKLVLDAINEVDGLRKRIDQDREPLEQDLKLLKTGIQ